MIVGLICFVFTVYVLLVCSLLIGSKLVSFTKKKSQKATTTFTVIIPFRNEADNLPHLLASIHKLKYPKEKLFFLFVNDDSSDDSCTLIEGFGKEFPEIQLTILQNERHSSSPKKDAIKTAIVYAHTSWIVTTDADCILPENWLAVFDQIIVEKQPKMLVAPVTYQSDASFFQNFQLLDFLSLQATTMGSFGLEFPFMCNGANLAYQKDAFLEVNGFTGNESIASGDDVFLLEKFVKKWTNSVVYVKSREAIVTTFPVDNWKKLIAQRVRWTSKSSQFTLTTGKLIGIIVILTNLGYCVLSIAILSSNFWELFVLIGILKIIIDSIFLWQILRFTRQEVNTVFMILSGLFYPFFTSYVFIRSLFASYTWKDRTFKK